MKKVSLTLKNKVSDTQGKFNRIVIYALLTKVKIYIIMYI